MPLAVGVFCDAVRSKSATLKISGNVAKIFNRTNANNKGRTMKDKSSIAHTVSNTSSRTSEEENDEDLDAGGYYKKRSNMKSSVSRSSKNYYMEKLPQAYREPPSPPAPPPGGLYEIVTTNVQSKMRTMLHLTHKIATSADDDTVKCSAFVSKSIRPMDRYILFIGSADGSPAGIWSARLCKRSGREGGGIVNGSLGSMLPFLTKANSEKYGVVVYDDIFDGHVYGDGSVDMTGVVQRFMTGWRNFVTSSGASHIFIVTYLEGGALLMETLRSHYEEMQRLISGIAFIESPHRVLKEDAFALRRLLAQWSVGYFAHQSALLSRLNDLEEEYGSICFSIGKEEADVEGLRNISGSVFAGFKARWSGFRSVSSGDGMDKSCYICQRAFNVRRWRRHCRTCNNACCEKCSSLDATNTEGCIRLCLTCHSLPSLIQWSRPRPIRMGEERSVYGDRPANGKLSLVDFELIDTLGSGACGKVLLVQKKLGKDAGKLFAMKVLKKKWVMDKDLVRQTMAERRILQDANHPYIVQLQYAFQNHDRLYMVMDYYSGGSLRHALQRKNRFSIRRSKVYLAQIFLAISHLHSLDIIYRDLKLENVVISAEGNVACTDFGLSKEDVDDTSLTRSFVGTCEYLAPELIRKESYGKAVDWWAFGILTYELIEGDSPFQHSVPSLLFEKIMRDEPVFGRYFPDDAVDLIRRLLHKDPRRRLGCGKDGVDEIKNHCFFNGIDWEALLHKQASIPLPPHHKDDVSDEGSLSRAIAKTREAREELMLHSPLSIPESLTESMHFDRFSYMGNDWHPSMSSLHADDAYCSAPSDFHEDYSEMIAPRTPTKTTPKYQYPSYRLRQPQHADDAITNSVSSSSQSGRIGDKTLRNTGTKAIKLSTRRKRVPDVSRTEFIKQESPLQCSI